MCNFSNADTFLRSALYSATTCDKLGRLRQLLTPKEDAEGGAIIFIFKKPTPTESPPKYPGVQKGPTGKFGVIIESVTDRCLLRLQSIALPTELSADAQYQKYHILKFNIYLDPFHALVSV